MFRGHVACLIKDVSTTPRILPMHSLLEIKCNFLQQISCMKSISKLAWFFTESAPLGGCYAWKDPSLISCYRNPNLSLEVEEKKDHCGVEKKKRKHGGYGLYTPMSGCVRALKDEK